MRRVAKELGTDTLGRIKFESMSGIPDGSWLGKYWTTWGEAITEAGLKPGKMNEAHDTEFLLASLADLTRRLGRFPPHAEIKMERVRNKEFPNHNVFGRLGNREALIAMVRDYASKHDGLHDILSLLPESAANAQDQSAVSDDSMANDGHVYMMKLGKHYKIGKTFSVPRRHREISLELPEKPDVVHSIRTDDADGIETYWHRRFEKKRTNGEWFALSPDDIKAFKRRKFM
jgi:hypothetical protein